MSDHEVTVLKDRLLAVMQKVFELEERVTELEADHFAHIRRHQNEQKTGGSDV